MQNFRLNVGVSQTGQGREALETMGILKGGDGTIKTKEEEGGGQGRNLGYVSGWQGMEITTLISSSDSFCCVGVIGT